MKILLKAIFLAVVLSAFGCARTETERINNRIGKLMSKIQFLKGQQQVDSGKQIDFDRLPLIPAGLKKWKKDVWIPRRIRELWEANASESDKLVVYKNITLREITITAWGWDYLSDPDVSIRMNDREIAYRKDAKEWSQSLSEKASSRDRLDVYDCDFPDSDDFIGKIQLEAETIPNGASGDVIPRTVQGRFGDSKDGFSYELTYEVRY